MEAEAEAIFNLDLKLEAEAEAVLFIFDENGSGSSFFINLEKKLAKKCGSGLLMEKIEIVNGFLALAKSYLSFFCFI